MKQQDAGIKRRGWYEAVSMTDRFQIDFPVPYDEWGAKVDENHVPAYSLGAVSSEGIEFLVTEFPQFGGFAAEDIRTLTNKIFEERSTRYKKYFKYQGKHASQIKVLNGSSIKIYRYILSPKYIYQISIIYPKSHTSLARKLTRKFLDSFEIKDKK